MQLMQTTMPPKYWKCGFGHTARSRASCRLDALCQGVKVCQTVVIHASCRDIMMLTLAARWVSHAPLCRLTRALWEHSVCQSGMVRGCGHSAAPTAGRQRYQATGHSTARHTTCMIVQGRAMRLFEDAILHLAAVKHTRHSCLTPHIMHGGVQQLMEGVQQLMEGAPKPLNNHNATKTVNSACSSLQSNPTLIPLNSPSLEQAIVSNQKTTATLSSLHPRPYAQMATDGSLTRKSDAQKFVEACTKAVHHGCMHEQLAVSPLPHSRDTPRNVTDP